MKYTINIKADGELKIETNGVITDISVEKEEKIDNRALWEEVKKASMDWTYRDKYKIGQIIPLDMGDEGIINMRLVAFGTDVNIYDTSIPMTFIATNVFKNRYRMNPCDKDEPGQYANDGWDGCELRHELQNIYCPIRDLITPAKKKQLAFTVENQPYIQETIDALWIPSIDEIATNGMYKFTDEMRKLGAIWWLRSANASTYFRRVYGGGSSISSSASVAGGVALGFCI